LKSTTFAVDLLAYARSLRAFSHDFPQSRTFDFRKTIMRKQEHVLEKIMLNTTSSSNPAAGHNGQGARTTRKDGCHPKYKNHGRIAGC
jgi:hypothetical protein